MTEASKARRRRPLTVSPLTVIKAPMLAMVDQDALRKVLRSMEGSIVLLPPSMDVTFISPRGTPPRVTTTGVSTRMGIGGRRGRKRRRAEERRVGRWLLFHPRDETKTCVCGAIWPKSRFRPEDAVTDCPWCRPSEWRLAISLTGCRPLAFAP